VGYKSEGYIPLSEFGTMPDGTPKVKVGDPVDVYLLRKEDQDGLVVLSKEIADQKIVWDSIAEAYERGEVVQGKVVRRIKGGLKVEIGNVKAFLPASQVELRPVQNFDRYIGKTLDMKVIKLSKRRRNIVLSRRVILEEEMEAKRKATLSTLEPEQLREGIVKNITQFGAFIDLGENMLLVVANQFRINPHTHSETPVIQCNVRGFHIRISIEAKCLSMFSINKVFFSSHLTVVCLV